MSKKDKYLSEKDNNYRMRKGPPSRNGGALLSHAAAQPETPSIGTILVVDDEPQMRRVLRATLIAREYKVVEAASGEDALEKFGVEPCDCILLDLKLPGLDGIDTCRAIRRRSNVPIIIVSIRDSEKDHLAAQEAGADDYITKPFGLDVLLSRIQEIKRCRPDSGQ